MAAGAAGLAPSIELPPSDFAARLAGVNALPGAGFAAWEFLPGMKFAERGAWWRGGAERGSAHEGLDLALFRTSDGRVLPLGAGARVPAVWPGEVVAIVGDFLGSSVFVAHQLVDAAGRRLLSVYGHLAPCPGLAPGGQLAGDDEVGVIADPAARGSSVPAHVHLTVAWVAADPPGTLDWSILRDPARALLIDPLPLL